MAGAFVVACQPMTPEQQFENAQALAAQGNNAEAIIALKTAIQGNQNNTEYRATLGKLLFSIGDLAGAEKELSRAHEAGSANDEVVNFLLASYHHQGKYEDVILLVDKLKNKTNEAYIFDFLASERMQQGVNRALLNAEKNLTDDWKKIIRVYQLTEKARYADALSIVRELPRLVALEREVMITESILLQSNGELDEALTVLQPVYEAWRSVPLVAFNYAELQVRQKDYSAVEGVAKPWLSVNEDNPWANYLMALVELNRENTEKALVHAQTAVQFGLDTPRVNALAGALALAAGNDESAYQFLLKADKQAPNVPSIMRNLAKVQLNLGYFDEAATLLSRIDLQNQSDVDFLRSASGYLYTQGYTDDAKQVLQSARKIRPEDRDILKQLSLMQVDSGEAAEATIRQLIGTDDSSVGGNVLLIRSLIEGGKIKEARDEANRFAAINPIEGAAMQGLVAFSDKGYADAIAYSDTALAIASNNLTALRVKMLSLYYSGLKQEAKEIAIMLVNASPNNQRFAGELLFLLEDAGSQNVVQELTALWGDVQSIPSGVITALARKLVADKQYAQILNIVEPRQFEVEDETNQLAITVLLELEKSEEAQRYAVDWYEKTESVEALLSLSALYEQQEDFEGLAQLLDSEMDKYPDDPRLVAVLHNALMRSGRFDNALEVTAKLADVGVPEALVAQYQGETYLAKRDFERALDSYAKSAALKPNFGTSVMLARTYSLLKQPQSGADALLNYIKVTNSKQPLHYHITAEFMVSQGLSEKAKLIYEQLLNLNERDDSAFNNLANLIMNQDAKKARNLAEQAVAINPSSANLDTLGWIQFQFSEFADAEDTLRRAHKSDPSSEVAALHLTEALIRVGKKTEAASIIKEYAPRSVDLKREWNRLTGLVN